MIKNNLGKITYLLGIFLFSTGVALSSYLWSAMLFAGTAILFLSLIISMQNGLRF